MDPPARTLLLASPYLHGPDVTEVQRLLGVAADGEFGPVTAGAVAKWKRTRGLVPTRRLGPAERRRLLADVPLRAVRTMEQWAQQGLREVPRGSNRVPALATLARRLRVAPAFCDLGFPWCAFGAFLAALRAGGETAAAGLRRGEFNALYAPALLEEARARRFGLRVVSTGLAHRGDLVLFDWDFDSGDPADHVARLVRGPTGGLVATVDGNSGDEGCVRICERPIGSVRAFARDS